MYKSNFVLAVKASGKVLREFDDTVYLPFGSEYSLLLKNMFSRKVRVHVKIDGKDVLDGKSLIIDAKDSIDLKRFITNGNLESGNAFKFIEKTAKIEKHRGNRAEDGLVTVEYEFESNWANSIQGGAITTTPFRPTPYDYPAYPQIWCDASADSREVTRGLVPKSAVNSLYSAQVNTAGVTAPGSVTSQTFTPAGHFFGDGIKHTITMQLKGLVEGQQEVQKPVTVTRLKRCSMCGTNVRQVAKFCHECGASVEIV